ncbi:MAG: hypothetical protein P3C10_09960 [Gemmatimonadota bacterium]|nr:hypothetical protein [Gemmatimonadota bacterium]
MPRSANAASPAMEPHAELAQLADRLRDALLSVVWRQWRVLGAGAASRSARGRASDAGTPPSRPLQSLVDPEALVLVSLLLLDHERRLGDLLHDWGARNADLLSVQRVKNLMADYPAPVRVLLTRRVAWFAAVARDVGKDLRWRSLAQAWPGSPGSWPDHVEDHAPDSPGARAQGVHAPAAASTKTRATRARLVADATLMLRLRLGLGVGVKSDLIAVLLARGTVSATVRDLAEATGYTVAAVRRAADDLAAARLIASRDGPPASYLVSYEAWAPLLGMAAAAPRWANWHNRFQFATAFLQWAATARPRPLSDYAFGAHGRELLEQHRAAFAHDPMAVWSAHTPIHDWRAFVGQSVRSLATWMDEMA